MGLAALLRGFLVVPFIIASSVQAAVFTYTGAPATCCTGGHVSATAEVTYTGAGSYILGSGLNFFELTAYDTADVIKASVASTDAGFSTDGFTEYLTVDGAGNPTAWFLRAHDLVSGELLFTTGYDSSYGTGDGAIVEGGFNFLIFNEDSPGQWGLTVPEPATLALLGIGLAGLGFSRRRR